ncbi:MAG: hypothetical protein LN575_01175 [Rickettsia endosymbiont of Gnoriste bilineata]|nr:hypothetical protein [Rickettsia endosymbiont of Gnoriste bilineata]
MSDNNINTTYLRTNYDIPPDPQAKPEAGKCNNYNLRKNNGAAKWIVMHYTECNFVETIDVFTRNTSNVSAHYVINTDVPFIDLYQISIELGMLAEEN